MAKSNRNQTPQTAAAAAFDVPADNAGPITDNAGPITDDAAPATDNPTPADDFAALSPVSQETPPVPTPQPARQGDEGRPYCPIHQCLMRANGTRDQVTSYTCPVPSCTCTEKRARPSVRISRDPLLCPNRTCASPQQYLEIDLAKSGALAHMQCPKCRFSLKVPRPQFAQVLQEQRRRPPRENLSDR